MKGDKEEGSRKTRYNSLMVEREGTKIRGGFAPYPVLEIFPCAVETLLEIACVLLHNLLATAYESKVWQRSLISYAACTMRGQNYEI